MSNVTILVKGHSWNEEPREFTILSRPDLEAIMDKLGASEAMSLGLKEAYGWENGKVYVYLDARTGELRTMHLDSSTFEHPFDSFYEIILCTVRYPLDIPNSDYYTDDKEATEHLASAIGVEEWIETNYGKNEFGFRLSNVFDGWSIDAEFDDQDIRRQLDELYAKQNNAISNDQC